MNLLDVYNLLNKGEITVAQAADSFGITERDLKFRLTRYGHELPLVLDILDKIADDRISREEAAVVLKRSPRMINKLQNSWRIIRPLKTYLVDKAVIQIKWEMRKRAAIEYIAGRLNLERAAELGNCTDRQVRRWVVDLLKEHFNMSWKELQEESMNKRHRMAVEIEDKEHIDKEKKKILDAINNADLALRDEALERVLSKRKRPETRKKE